MKTTRTVVCTMVAGLLAGALPVSALAMPGDAHDDSTYASDAGVAVVVAGPVAGPKAPAFDDAPYPDVAVDEPRSGEAVALAGGPEAYAHDDVTYTAPSAEPAEASGAAAVAVATARR